MPPPTLEVSFTPQEQPRVTKSHTMVGTVSAVPETLRQGAQGARAMADWLEEKMREGESHWNRLRESSPWAALGALPIAAGIYRLVEEYRAEAEWLDRIAQAFEDAGANGPLSDFQITLAVVGMDRRYVQQLLSDQSLSDAQLKALVEALAKDPTTSTQVAQYTTEQLNGLSLNSDAKQIKRVTLLLEGVSSNPSTSAKVLTGLKPEGLLERVGLSGDYLARGHNENAQAYAESLRAVFRSGEPHLATIDAGLSRDYANKLVDYVSNPAPGGTSVENRIPSLSFLLYQSQLSTPFLVSMGGALERVEQRFTDGSGGWTPSTAVAEKMGPLFPPDKWAASHDPAAFYMSALAKNPEAAHIFFAKSDDHNGRVRYWVQDRQWAHDRFDGVLSAIDAATTQGDNLHTEESAKLVSSTIEFLANRTQSANYVENPLSQEESIYNQVRPGSFGPTATRSMVHILAPYMSSVDQAVTLPGVDHSGAGLKNVEAVDTVRRSDLPGIEFRNMPRFNGEDLAVVTKAIVSSEEGQAQMRQMVSSYQDLHFRLVTDTYYDHSDPENAEFKKELEKALNKDAKLEAFYVQQVGDANIAMGRNKDAAIDTWMSAGGDAIREFPITSLAGLNPASRGVAVIEFFADQAFNETEGALKGALTQHGEEAEDKAREAAGTALVNRRDNIVRVLYDQGVITSEDITTMASGHGRSRDEVEKWVTEGFPKKPDNATPNNAEQQGDTQQTGDNEYEDAKRDYLNIMDQLATDHFPYHEYEQTYYTQFQGPLK